eukprot:13831550-Alexandrium_andersonii.AAC.1
MGAWVRTMSQKQIKKLMKEDGDEGGESQWTQIARQARCPSTQPAMMPWVKYDSPVRGWRCAYCRTYHWKQWDVACRWCGAPRERAEHGPGGDFQSLSLIHISEPTRLALI